MKTRLRLLMALILLSLVFLGNLEAQDIVPKAHDVEIRVYLIDIENVDTVAQSFTANLAVVMRWHDPELVHEGPASKIMPLDKIWSPRIQILNQQRLTSTLPFSAEVFPGGEVLYRQRYRGSFTQPLELESFPFDSQTLKVKFANVGFAGGALNLTPSPRSHISKELTLSDWEVTGWSFVNTEFTFVDQSSHIDGMVLSVDIDREENFFMYKVIFPLILIVMMSWMVFWIDPALAASQISVSVTAMLTMIAYRFALAGMIPRLGILTSLDYFVLASTLVVFLAMVEVVYTAYLSTNDQLEKARRVDWHARWIAPVIFFALMAETLFFRIWV